MPITESERRQLQQFAPDHLKVIEATERAAAASERKARRQEKRKRTEDLPAEFIIDLSTISEELTIGDADDAERISGVAFPLIVAGLSNGRMRGLPALVWVLRRREDPKYTYEQARAIPMARLTELIVNSEEDEEAAPLGPGASPTA